MVVDHEETLAIIIQTCLKIRVHFGKLPPQKDASYLRPNDFEIKIPMETYSI
jgi:hypothetical protein